MGLKLGMSGWKVIVWALKCLKNIWIVWELLRRGSYWLKNLKVLVNHLNKCKENREIFKAWNRKVQHRNWMIQQKVRRVLKERKSYHKVRLRKRRK